MKENKDTIEDKEFDEKFNYVSKPTSILLIICTIIIIGCCLYINDTFHLNKTRYRIEVIDNDTYEIINTYDGLIYCSDYVMKDKYIIFIKDENKVEDKIVIDRHDYDYEVYEYEKQ